MRQADLSEYFHFLDTQLCKCVFHARFYMYFWTSCNNKHSMFCTYVTGWLDREERLDCKSILLTSRNIYCGKNKCLKREIYYFVICQALPTRQQQMLIGMSKTGRYLHLYQFAISIQTVHITFHIARRDLNQKKGCNTFFLQHSKYMLRQSDH